MKPIYRPVHSDVSKLFKMGVYNNGSEFDHPWHYHPEFELTYILSSNGVRYVGNSIENFSEDDLVLLGSNLPHCWSPTKGSPDEPRSLVLYLNYDFLDMPWVQSFEFNSIRKLLDLSKNGIKFNSAVAQNIKLRFFELLNVSSIDRVILLLQILKELAQTSEYALLCEQGFSYELNTTHNERINAVYKFIERNYSKKISLSNIAPEVNMSEEYFSRFFSKTMGKSFFEFLNEYRISRACNMLIETDKQITEICYSSGFESIPFFYRQFKKFKHCQPKNYRAEYQKISEIH